MELKILDFYAEWCAPCKALEPSLEEICEKRGIILEKVNVEENPEIADNYKVFSLPTLIVLKDGFVIGRVEGNLPYETLKRKIDEILLE